MGFATKRQVVAIHTLKSKAGMDEENYRAALADYGTDSSKGLHFEEARDFIQKLSAVVNGVTSNGSFGSALKPELPPIKRRYRGMGNRGTQRHLTDLQAERIEILEDLLEWNLKRTAGFINRQINKTMTVEMLMNYEAVKVITGMTKIIAGPNKALFKKLNRLNNTELREWKS